MSEDKKVWATANLTMDDVRGRGELPVPEDLKPYMDRVFPEISKPMENAIKFDEHGWFTLKNGKWQKID